MGRPDTPKGLAYDFIKANPKTSLEEVARALGVSQATVSRARRKLVKEGVLTKWSKTAHRLGQKRSTMHDPTIASDEPMTAEQLHRVLSKAAREAQDGAELRPIAAELIKLLPKPEASEDTVGPGVPLDMSEMIERGGLMLRALGADNSLKAIEWARNITAEGMGLDGPKEPSANHPEAV